MSKPVEESLRPSEIKKSLRYSIADASAYNVMVGKGESYFSTFLVAMGASAFQIGVATAIPQFFAGLSQRFIVKFDSQIASRKNFIIRVGLLQAFTWFVITLIAYLSLKGSIYVWIAILVFTLGIIFAYVGNPVWASWMADIVEVNERGTYFGKRNFVAGFTLLVSTLFGGLMLHILEPYLGMGAFATLFAIAFVARLISIYFLSLMVEPKQTYSNISVSLTEIFASPRWKDTKNFLMLIFSMILTTNIAGPFFLVYMLRDLQLDYLQLTTLVTIPMLVKFASMKAWGKLSDRYGDRRILGFAAFSMPIIPWLWLVSKDFNFLILCQAYSGFIWSAYELATFNYIISVSEGSRRTSLVANYNFLNNTGAFLGAMVGSYLSIYVNDYSVFWITGIPILFLLSGVGRLLSALFFMPSIEEKRVCSLSKDQEHFTSFVNPQILTEFTREFFLSWESMLNGKKKQ